MSSKEVIPAKEGAKSRARLVKVVVRKGLRTKVDRRRGRYKTKTKKQKDEEKKKKEREALKRLKGLPEYQALLKKIKANEKLIEELKKGALIKGGLGGGTATRRPPSGGSSINRAFPSSSTSSNNITINELLKQNKELNRKIDELSKKFDQARTQEEFKKDDERRKKDDEEKKDTEEERRKRTTRFEGPRETFRGGDDDDDDDDDDDIPPPVARPQRAPTRDTPEPEGPRPRPAPQPEGESSAPYSEDGPFAGVFSNNPRIPHNQAQLQQTRRNERNSSQPTSLFIRSLSTQEEPEVDTEIRPPIEVEPEVDTEIRPITLTEEDRQRIQTISQTPQPDTAPEALDIDLEQRTNIEAIQIRDNPATQRQTSTAPRLADRARRIKEEFEKPIAERRPTRDESERRGVIETENIIQGAVSRIENRSANVIQERFRQRQRDRRAQQQEAQRKLIEEAEILRKMTQAQERATTIRERIQSYQQEIESINTQRQDIVNQIVRLNPDIKIRKSSSPSKIVKLLDDTNISSETRQLLTELLRLARDYNTATTKLKREKDKRL
jgi:outer membrane murein-binding lipoprotein Lpp